MYIDKFRFCNICWFCRYIYFPCSRRQFGLPGPSLLEIDHDERPENGSLASSLGVGYSLACLQLVTPSLLHFPDHVFVTQKIGD